MDRKIDFDTAGILTNEKGNLKRLPSEFSYEKISLKDYHAHANSGQWEIYATYDCDSDLHDFTEDIPCKKPDLLLKMLDLRERLPDELFNQQSKMIYFDSHLNENIINTIIAWCRRNGFPFKSGIEPAATSKSKSLIKAQSPRHIGFTVLNFIYQLNEVYSAFYLYRAIIGKDVPTKKTILVSLPVVINGVGTESRIFKEINGIPKWECIEIFESKYQKISFVNQIAFDGGPHIQVKTESLFDAAFYQLAILLNEPNREIKECPICHEYFEPKYQRQTYCEKVNHKGNPTCYPQKFYKQTLKKKKNGQTF